MYTVAGYRNKYAQYGPGVLPGFPVGGVGVPPFERAYMEGVSANAYDTAGIGSWEQFRVTAQTPIGIFSYGVKDFPFGTGATLANNTRTEAFVTVVPYGPFSFIHGIWLSQGAFLDGYSESPDGGRKNTLFQGLFMLYNAADLQLGAGWIGRYHHLGRGDLIQAGLLAPGNGPVTGSLIAQDGWLNFWLAHMKYNNGRFFANAEYSWVTFDLVNVFNGGIPAANAFALGNQPRFLFQHAFAEAGVLCGPSKLTFMWAWSPGQNLINHDNDILPVGTHTTNSRPYAINYQAMQPYNTLMFYTYGGGNNQFDSLFTTDGVGCMSDAWDWLHAWTMRLPQT